MSFWETICVPAEMRTFALLVASAGVGVSAVALVAGRLMRRRSVPLRYGVQFAGVVGLLAAPALVAVGQSLVGVFSATTEETVRIPVERLDDALASTLPQEPHAAAEPRATFGEIAATLLIGSWALGILVGLLRLARGLWRQRRALVGEPWQPAWWTGERRQALAQKVGLRSFPPVWQSPFAPLPMVVGLWRPRVVLPASALDAWAPIQWEAVLLHEAAHIARGDPWAALAQGVATALFWWCPLVYRLSRRVHELREAICDDYALESSCDHIAYAELLMESAERLINLRTLPIAVGLFDSARGGLEERITRLLAKEKNPMTQHKLATRLLGAAALLLGCLTITAATAYSQAPSPQKRIQIKIIVDGKELDLNDARLLDYLEAARKAEAGKEPLPQTAVSPNGKLVLLTPDGKIVLMTQPGIAPPVVAGKRSRAPNTGTIHDQKIDPRIEDLVKQAQDIEAIRKAQLERIRQLSEAAEAEAQKKRNVEIEELVKRAEKIKPGAGAQIRIILRAGDAVRMMQEPMIYSMVPQPPQFQPRLDDFTKRIQELEAAGRRQEAAALKELWKATNKLPAKGPDLEVLSQQVERLKKELDELRQRLEKPKAPIRPRDPAAPSSSKNPGAAQLQGQVLRVDGDSILVDVGADNGAHKDQSLDVYRAAPEPRYLGKLRIVAVQAQQSVGVLTTGKTPGSPVRVNDLVTSGLTAGQGATP